MRTNKGGRRRLTVALMACGVLLVAACSDYEGYLESQGVDRASSDEVQRSADAEEGRYWDAVDPAKGGNGWAWDTLGEDYCFNTQNGDRTLKSAAHNLCFMLENETKRFTTQRGLWGKFLLTVSQFWTGNDYTALGGKNTSSYFGVLHGKNDCDRDCNGRLFPNPFGNTAVMQFAGQGAREGSFLGIAGDIAGIRTRLFVNSGALPMKLSDSGAQPEYDLPSLSSTNTASCTAGAWLTCTKDPAMPTKGKTVIARYRIGTLPLEIDIVNALGAKTWLRRQGDAQVSGLLLEWVGEVNTSVVPAESIGRYGGYRAADGRTPSFTAQYIVTDPTGNATPASCKATDTRPLGCGTLVTLNVSLDKDAKNTSTCTVSTSDSRIIKCEVSVTGSPTGPMTATVRVADF